MKVFVTHNNETKIVVCATRREFLNKIVSTYNVKRSDIQLIDQASWKEITVNDLNDDMRVELRTKPSLNGQRQENEEPVNLPDKDLLKKKLIEEPVKLPDKELLKKKLIENNVLTGTERKFLVSKLDFLFESCTSPPNNKRKLENGARQTANKKVQFPLENTNKHAHTQTDKELPHQLLEKPSTSKDLSYQSKRLALEEKKDPKKVCEIMNNTFDERRQFILMHSPVILHIKEKYPLLFDISEVRNELNRIFYAGKDEEFLSNVEKYSKTILSIVEEEDHVLNIIRSKLKTLASDHQKQYAIQVGSILMLSNILCEKRLYLNTEDEPSPMNNYPRIEAPCKVDKLFYDTHLFKVYVEGILLCEANDFKEAVLCLMASFFIFNISYPDNMFNTYVVLEKLFLEANDTDGNDIDEKTSQIIKLLRLKTNAS